MKIECVTYVTARPSLVLEYMLSDAFVEEFEKHLEAVSRIEEFEVIRRSGAIEQRMRFEAPTKLPGFLKRYEAKMPLFVYWEERGRWDLGTMKMELEIMPDAPEHWRQRYDYGAYYQLFARDAGTELVQFLELEVHAFGLGKLVERALGPEIREIFETRGDVVRKHFLSPSSQS